jgi:hypothetical protein
LVWSNCTADKNFKQDFSFPAGPRLFPYSSKIFLKTNPLYPADLTKVDVIWLDNTIEVNEPLRSFGGDIILVAETININAPIDSRVYIENEVDHYAPTDPSSGTWGAYYTPSSFNPTYAAAFDEYYNKCLNCDVYATRRAELPAGVGAPTPDSRGPVQALDGFDAPGKTELDYSKLRSGNIFIFAKTVHIADSLLHPTYSLPRAECAANVATQKRVSFALNAGGLDGGRGGTGSKSRCNGPVTPPPSGFYQVCLPTSFLAKGGISGSGSDGADAGDITVFLANESTVIPVDEENILRAVSMTKGGKPTIERLQTPAALGDQAVTESRCSFLPVSSDSQLVSGQDGRVRITDGPSIEGLHALTSFLAAKDLRNDYDYNALLAMAKVDLTIYDFNPSTVYSDYLLRTLLAAEIRHADDVESVFADHNKDVGHYLPWLFEEMPDADFLSVQRERHDQELLDALGDYRSKDGAMSPFKNSGGLFEVPDAVAQTMAAHQLLRSISLIGKTLTEINSELQDIDDQVLLFAQQKRATALKAQIIALENAIAAAQAEAEKAAQVPGTAEQLANLKDLATAVAGIVGAIYTGQYEAAAAFVEPAAKAYGKLTAEIPGRDDATVRQLRQQLRVVDQTFESFSSFMNETRDGFMTLKYQALMDQLHSRKSIQTELNSQAILGPQIIKVALISYFTDLQRSESKLKQNLAEIHKYLDGFPYTTAQLSLSSIQWSCTDKAECLVLEASKSPRVVWYDMMVAGKRRSLALYVLGPLNQQESLPVFRLDRSAIRVADVR